ncbi:uncharacterized protein HHUB_2050 [Halobacterium hubeiense]|jgi:hypothetical protein|uniref:Uncharacterized protein n=2 Tax=Halobacterium TaxID=2239 RepID=A0A0U5H274_9EURY|nr:hypothetical protein [Halobacterium hubeiense]CQH54141.1 uncharacterized protein HHUB_2050 [Halobacterium hubeiense]
MTDDHAHDDSGRVTAPMQEFSTGQVGTGFLVLLVGLAVAYLVPAFL